MGRARTAIDRTWPGLALGALVLTIAIAIVGVLAAPKTTDVDRIDDTVHRFAVAVAERRGEDACAELTPAAQKAVAAQLGTLSCGATIRSFGVGLDAPRLRVARVVAATVTGKRASVAREQLLVNGAPYRGALTLERSGGRWRLATLPS